MVHLRVEVIPVSIRLVRVVGIRILNLIRFFTHLIMEIATIISVMVGKLFLLILVVLVAALLGHVLEKVSNVLILSIRTVLLLLRLVKTLESSSRITYLGRLLLG